MHRFLPVLLIPLLAACSGGGGDEGADAAPRWVMTAPATPVDAGTARLSGTVRARFETPVSFQAAGRIRERRVDAGDRVEAGDALFGLDPEEFRQAVAVARADLEAAQAELETARAETRRNRDLLQREFISPQVFERVQLAEKSAAERVDAARARLEQAQIRLGYTDLAADTDGVLMAVTAEPGQVVAAGQRLAMLARDGAREVEVFLPERLGVPRTGRIVGGPGTGAALEIREAAGSADPTTRTWKARYALADAEARPRLGSVVKVALDVAGPQVDVLQVPVGAVNERGHGPQVWVIENGRAAPVRVTLLDMDTEHARIAADLPAGTEVIALGTHLLESGMAVRALEQ